MASTLFIACAALGREVKAMIKKHGWDAEFEAINAKLHLEPSKIGPAVEARLCMVVLQIPNISHQQKE